jgi:hypothetical protein
MGPLVPDIALLQWPTVLILGAISLVLLVSRDRRLALLALLAQYIWLGTQMSYDIYRSVALVRLGLGLALCLILYISAHHIENISRQAQVPDALNTGFRLVVMALGALLTWGMWVRYPLAAVPDGLGLASYWLVFDGLLLMLMSTDPLRMGLGLMTVLNGFEGVYLYQEHGLVITGVVGIVDICVALGITLFAEAAAGALAHQQEPLDIEAAPSRLDDEMLAP